MLLAAGLGTRMAPLADRVAKAALPVLDEPVVLGLARMLAAQGVEEIVVNAHSHPQSLRQALRDSPVPVVFSNEPTLRGTGGGILGARRWLEGPDSFVALNADMVLDLDLPGLLRAHREAGALATLLLRDDPRKSRFGELGYNSRGLLCRVTDRALVGEETGTGLFTGVQVLEGGIFGWMPDRSNFDLVADVYVPLLKRQLKIRCCLQDLRARWWPVGTPQELLQANLGALEQRLASHGSGDRSVHAAPGARLRGEVLGPAWIGHAAEVKRGARVGPWVILGGGSRVERGSRLERTLVLPGAVVPENTVLREAIIGMEDTWKRG
jgi:NDP-sugar pyrophosphorylase family protein